LIFPKKNAVSLPNKPFSRDGPKKGNGVGRLTGDSDEGSLGDIQSIILFR